MSPTPESATPESATPENREIHRADPRHRRRVLALLLGVVLAAAAGLWALDRGLAAAQALTLTSVRQAAEQTLGLARWFFGTVTVAGVLFGLYLLVLAVRVWLSQRYPPPRARVLRDTPVSRGRAAKLRALVAAVLALAILALALEMPRRGLVTVYRVLAGPLSADD